MSAGSRVGEKGPSTSAGVAGRSAGSARRQWLAGTSTALPSAFSRLRREKGDAGMRVLLRLRDTPGAALRAQDTIAESGPVL